MADLQDGIQTHPKGTSEFPGYNPSAEILSMYVFHCGKNQAFPKDMTLAALQPKKDGAHMPQLSFQLINKVRS